MNSQNINKILLMVSMVLATIGVISIFVMFTRTNGIDWFIAFTLIFIIISNITTMLRIIKNKDYNKH